MRRFAPHLFVQHDLHPPSNRTADVVTVQGLALDRRRIHDLVGNRLEPGPFPVLEPNGRQLAQEPPLPESRLREFARQSARIPCKVWPILQLPNKTHFILRRICGDYNRYSPHGSSISRTVGVWYNLHNDRTGHLREAVAGSMVTVHPLPSTFAVPVRFPRLPGLTNGKCALSRATLRRRQGVLSRMTSSCLSGTDRLSADAVAVSRHGQFAPDGNPVRQPTQAASASPSGRRGSGGSTGSRPAESSSAAPTSPAAETPGRARRRRR